MSTEPEIWFRPWALADAEGRHRARIGASGLIVPEAHRAALWLYHPKTRTVDHSHNRGLEPLLGFDIAGADRSLGLMPMALRGQTPIKLPGVSGTVISWPSAPTRPPAQQNPTTDEEVRAHRLMLRGESVWDRLHEVDLAIADPANLWSELRRQWVDENDDADPRMDVIVRHAFQLSRILDELDRAPRRVLRRTHQMIPISRVQEMDRRAINWLVKQPGETLAERAGDSQRLLAVARQESFDTLENRVVRSYAELAGYVARDYLERIGRKRHSRRAERVRDFGKRAKRLARDLAARGVRTAEPGITPNYVLQQNPRYRSVWNGWLELIRQDRLLDELWRWQAASWEEFCALALMVAITTVPGSRLIASSPLRFRDEQKNGSWVQHDNPLGVFFLPEQKLVIDVQFRMTERSSAQADLGASLWIRFGHTDDPKGFHKYVAIWPIWDVTGGVVQGEAQEVASFLPRYRQASVIGGLIIRPAAEGRCDTDTHAGAHVVAMGCEGEALRDAIAAMSRFVSSQIVREAKQ